MRLLKIEFKKIVGNKSFKVFSLMFLVFLPALAILAPLFVNFDINGEDFYPFIPSDYEASWYAISFISSWFCFFLLSFILIYHITNEYTYRTVRQNVIDGFNRNDYIKGKVYLMLTLLGLATLYVFLIGIIGGLIFSSYEPKDPTMIQEFFKAMEGDELEFDNSSFGNLFDGVENIIRFFIQCLGGFSIAFLVAFLVKRGILAVLIFYGYFLIEKIGGAIFYNNGMESLVDFSPTFSFINVLPYPSLMKLLSGISSPESFDWMAIGLTLLYSLAAIFLAKRLFMKRDIS